MGIKSVTLGVLWDVAIATGCSKSNPRPVRPLSVVRRSVPRNAKPYRDAHLPRWEMICRFPDTGGRFRRCDDASASDAHLGDTAFSRKNCAPQLATPCSSVFDEPKSKRESIFDFDGAPDLTQVQKSFDDAVVNLVDSLS